MRPWQHWSDADYAARVADHEDRLAKHRAAAIILPLVSQTALVSHIAPVALPPNWAAILSAVAATVALFAIGAAAIYARRTYERSVERDKREQASKVAFWGELIDDGDLRLMYVNTSGLPVWDVSVKPYGAINSNSSFRSFSLAPTDSPIELDARWQWMGSRRSELADMYETIGQNYTGSLGRYAEIAATIAGGGHWKRVAPSESKGSFRMQAAGMVASFTDTAGARWSRSPAGGLTSDRDKSPLRTRITLALQGIAKRFRRKRNK